METKTKTQHLSNKNSINEWVKAHPIIACFVLVALFSGVVVSYYLEVVHRREKITATVFLDKMEHLTELVRKNSKKCRTRRGSSVRGSNNMFYKRNGFLSASGSLEAV